MNVISPFFKFLSFSGGFRCLFIGKSSPPFEVVLSVGVRGRWFWTLLFRSRVPRFKFWRNSHKRPRPCRVNEPGVPLSRESHFVLNGQWSSRSSPMERDRYWGPAETRTASVRYDSHVPLLLDEKTTNSSGDEIEVIWEGNSFVNKISQFTVVIFDVYISKLHYLHKICIY